MQAKANKMGTMPVNRLLITMALPMMLSMLVQALYNVVDSIFVSRICEDALTAVSMAFPMQNLMIGVSAGLGVGTNALLSRALGAGDRERANRVAVQGLFLTCIGYLIFLLLGLFAIRAFYQLQGAAGAIAEYGYDYLSIVLIYSFGIFFQMIFERLLQGTGRTLFTMFTQGTGAIINIILDPILIFGYCGLPKMGIKGAAVATVLGQIIAAILAFFFNQKKNTDVKIRLKGFKPDGEIIRTILSIGVPSVLMIAIGSVMTFCVNKILVVFTSTAVAVFGVYFKLQSFVFMPIFGMNNAMVPIVAFNYGAKRRDRMDRTLKLAIIYATAIMLTALVTAQLIPNVLLSLFNASPDMMGIGVPAIRTITISFVFAGLCVIAGAYYQALGHGMYSLIVSFTRQLVFLVPLVFVFAQTGKLDLVWFAWPIAEIASVVLSVYFLRRVRRDTAFPEEK